MTANIRFLLVKSLNWVITHRCTAVILSNDYMLESARRWRIVKNAKTLLSYVKHF